MGIEPLPGLLEEKEKQNADAHGDRQHEADCGRNPANLPGNSR